MLVLALDSTSPDGSYALSLRDGHLDVRAGDPQRSWSQRLPGDLLDLLAAHGARLSDVDVYAVVSGPGSMTGLRVGIATIQGLAFATGRRVAAIPALDALCEFAAPRARALSADALTGAWVNAMRGEVFAQLCAPRDEGADPAVATLDGPRVARPDTIADRWREVGGTRPIVVVGDEDLPHAAALQERLGAQLTWVGRPLLAGVAAGLARRCAARGALVAPHAVRPDYIRRPDAEVARERGRATTAAIQAGRA